MQGNNTWTLRVHVKPFVDWIWGGCLLMALGGVIALSDRRYRQKARRADVGEAVPAAAASPSGAAVAPEGATARVVAGDAA